MSAVVSICMPDAVYLLADGAGYDEDGVVRWIGEKIVRAETVPFAVATRGDQKMGDHFAAGLVEGAERFGVDRFLDGLEAELVDWRADPTMVAACAGAKAVEVLIAGWSPIRGGFHVAFQTSTDGKIKVEPFTPVSPPTLFYAGSLSDDTELPDELLPTEGETAPDYARRGGLAILERFRQCQGKAPGGGLFYGIGGHCDLAIVSKDGVTVERLRTWPDKIGERIVPGVVAA